MTRPTFEVYFTGSCVKTHHFYLDALPKTNSEITGWFVKIHTTILHRRTFPDALFTVLRKMGASLVHVVRVLSLQELLELSDLRRDRLLLILN